MKVVALNLAAHAAHLAELTRDLDVAISHADLSVPWDEVAAPAVSAAVRTRRRR